MAIIGRREIRPMSTTSQATYAAVVCRCLLCGTKQIYVRDYLDELVSDGAMVVIFCDCYGDRTHQPVRIIPNEREAGPLVLSTKAI
jgi:hypothetical protein